MDAVFVITRNSRRVEPKNYLSLEEAKASASNLIQGLSNFGIQDSIKVVKTKYPYKIR